LTPDFFFSKLRHRRSYKVRALKRRMQATAREFLRLC